MTEAKSLKKNLYVMDSKSQFYKCNYGLSVAMGKKPEYFN